MKPTGHQIGNMAHGRKQLPRGVGRPQLAAPRRASRRSHARERNPRLCLVTPEWAVVLNRRPQSNYAGANGHPGNVGDRGSRGAGEVPAPAHTHGSGRVLRPRKGPTPRTCRESRLRGTTAGSGAPARRPPTSVVPQSENCSTVDENTSRRSRRHRGPATGSRSWTSPSIRTSHGRTTVRHTE